MIDKNAINFDAPAVLRKWPSIRNERVSAEDGRRPYLIAEGTLEARISDFPIIVSPVGRWISSGGLFHINEALDHRC
jgi:hypothetical protein